MKYLKLLPALLLLICGASCNLYRYDRCYVEEPQYQVAYDIFVDTGSLDLVRRRLNDFEWERCKINECIYRLEKEFEVISP